MERGELNHNHVRSVNHAPTILFYGNASLLFSGSHRGSDARGAHGELRVQRGRPAAGRGADPQPVCGSSGAAAQSHGRGRAGEVKNGLKTPSELASFLVCYDFCVIPFGSWMTS